MPSFGVLVLAFVICIITEAQGKRIFSHILYRHGDRVPSAFYPTDPYSNQTIWPVGLGQLTNTGKLQHFQLGQWLRRRYDEEFLPKRYSPSKIYVRSTDVDRTIDSALCNLAGLFPPTDDQVWNHIIQWQPIPVHVVPSTTDWILGADVPACSVYEKDLENVFNTSYFQSFITKYHPLISYVLKNTGNDISFGSLDIIKNVTQIRDTLYVEALYKKQLPLWTEKIYPSKWIDEFEILYFTMHSFNPLLGKFRCGYFLKDILDRSSSKVNGTLSPDIFVYVYSGHDINIATILNCMGMYDDTLIQYASALLFELRIVNDVPCMEIFYKRSPESEIADHLYIPYCGCTCPLTKLYELYDAVLPKTDFNSECNVNT